MDYLFILPIFIFLLLIPALTGLMAVRSGRKFWRWFGIGIFLPVIANVILLFLPYRYLPREQEPTPVGNDEIFDHLFIGKEYSSPGFDILCN